MKASVAIIGTGQFLPDAPVTNTDLAARYGLDTSDEWIQQRTGIKQRYLADANTLTSDLAAAAAINALQNAGLTAQEVDLIVVATTTPDRTFPSTAVLTQAKIGAHHAAAFDVQAVCSGFIYGLATARAFLQNGQARTALVIGAETMSRVLDWNDRSTSVLFGDGAGAAVLRLSDTPHLGILDTHLASDGRYADVLCTTGGISLSQTAGVLTMEGKEVFRHAVQKMSDSCRLILERNNLTIDDITAVVPHQANRRILEAVAERLSLPLEKLISTVEMHANTSASSIPLALDTARPKGLILMTALGAGFTWGSALLKS